MTTLRSIHPGRSSEQSESNQRAISMQFTLRSIRPGRSSAGSISSGRFEAASTKTPSSASTPGGNRGGRGKPL